MKTYLTISYAVVEDILVFRNHIANGVTQHRMEFQHVFNALKQLIQQPNPPRKQIGFKS